MGEGVQRAGITVEYIETQFQLIDEFTKPLVAATFIKFTDMLVVSKSTLNFIVKKSKDPTENKSDEPAEKKQRK